MALQIKLKWKGHCERHPKYNPEKTGQGGIRGGCPQCESLLEIFNATLGVKKSISILQGVQLPDSARLTHALSD